MGFLTSEECDGRFPGTPGNKKAEEYIEDCFEKIGLDKYNGSYKFEYTHKYLKPIGEDYKLAFTFSNGEVAECKYGKDFFTNTIGNFVLQYRLTFDENDNDINNSVIAIDSDKTSLKNIVNKSKAILIKTDNFTLQIAAKKENGIPLIQISNKLYEILNKKENADVSIKFNVDGYEEEILQNNIVGVIPGENHDNAVVVSAHFDHVGSKANKVFRGAVDNASGTAVIIDIARRIKEYSSKQKLNEDIIICAYNGEEDFQQGSNAFANDIKNRYQNIYNINIDCVGIKDGGDLILYGEDKLSEELAATMEDHLIKEGFKIKKENGLSDHSSFILNNMCAVSILQDDMYNIIHTLNDNLDKIDFKSLNNVSKAITDFIISNTDKVYKPAINSKNLKISDEEMALFNAEQELKFNQYKLTMINGKQKIVHKNTIGFDGEDAVKEFNMIYPDFKLKDKLGNYQLCNILVLDRTREYVENPEIDKIYTINSLPENILELHLDYKKDSKSDEKEVCIAFITLDKNNNFNKERDAEYYERLNMAISKDGIDIEGEKYNFIYSKKDKSIKRIYRIVKNGDKSCKIEIGAPYKQGWEFETKEAIIKAYKDLQLKSLISDMLKQLKVSP